MDIARIGSTAGNLDKASVAIFVAPFLY